MKKIILATMLLLLFTTNLTYAAGYGAIARGLGSGYGSERFRVSIGLIMLLILILIIKNAHSKRMPKEKSIIIGNKKISILNEKPNGVDIFSGASINKNKGLTYFIRKAAVREAEKQGKKLIEPTEFYSRVREEYGMGEYSPFACDAQMEYQSEQLKEKITYVVEQMGLSYDEFRIWEFGLYLPHHKDTPHIVFVWEVYHGEI